MIYIATICESRPYSLRSSETPTTSRLRGIPGRTATRSYRISPQASQRPLPEPSTAIDGPRCHPRAKDDSQPNALRPRLWIPTMIQQSAVSSSTMTTTTGTLNSATHSKKPAKPRRGKQTAIIVDDDGDDGDFEQRSRGKKPAKPRSEPWLVWQGHPRPIQHTLRVLPTREAGYDQVPRPRGRHVTSRCPPKLILAKIIHAQRRINFYSLASAYRSIKAVV
jgi:hypothetical protein